MTESPASAGTVERDAAWLALQQRLTARAAHDVRNALNGLAVNVEVVRARAARGAGGEHIAPFADSAAEQLEGAIALVEALLALARPPREPADGGGAAGVVRGLAPLVAAAGRAVDVSDEAAEPPAIDGALLRLLLAAGLLALVEGEGGGDDAGPLRCAVAPDRDGGTRVAMRGARPAELPPAVRRLAADAGVALTPAPDGIDMTIPAFERR